MSSELTKRIGVYKRKVAPHGPEAVAEIERRFMPIASDLDAAQAARGRVLASIKLSEPGKQEALAELAAGDGAATASKLLKIKETVRQELEALLGAENAAQAGLVAVPGGGYVREKGSAQDRTSETVLLEGELRAQLQDLKRLEVANMYLQAVMDGSDPLLVSAIERAPSRRFALVDDVTLDRAREIRVSQSPMRDAIARQRDAYDLNSLLVELAWMELHAAFPTLRDSSEPLPKRKAVTLPWGVEPLQRPVQERAS